LNQQIHIRGIPCLKYKIKEIRKLSDTPRELSEAKMHGGLNICKP
jgi:hypothetical protein